MERRSYNCSQQITTFILSYSTDVFGGHILRGSDGMWKVLHGFAHSFQYLCSRSLQVMSITSNEREYRFPSYCDEGFSVAPKSAVNFPSKHPSELQTGFAAARLAIPARRVWTNAGV